MWRRRDDSVVRTATCDLNENRLRRKADGLERQITSFELEKLQAVSQMEQYKQDVQERERRARDEHAAHIESLTLQLGETKLAFETRLGDFERSLAASERERAKNDDSKSLEYQRQVADLKRKIDSHELNFAKRISEVEQERDAGKARFQEERERAEEELRACRRECDEKLDKARQFREHELAAAERSVSAGKDLEAGWREREQQLKVDADKAESRHRKRLEEMSLEIEMRKEEADELRLRLESAQKDAEHTNASAKVGGV